MLPNNFATSGQRLSFNSFLWFSQTSLEACGHRAQYFAGFAHFRTLHLPLAGSKVGRSANAVPLWPDNITARAGHPEGPMTAKALDHASADLLRCNEISELPHSSNFPLHNYGEKN